MNHSFSFPTGHIIKPKMQSVPDPNLPLLLSPDPFQNPPSSPSLPSRLPPQLKAPPTTIPSAIRSPYKRDQENRTGISSHSHLLQSPASHSHSPIPLSSRILKFFFPGKCRSSQDHRSGKFLVRGKRREKIGGGGELSHLGGLFLVVWKWREG
jgi:hypothetical protein